MWFWLFPILGALALMAALYGGVSAWEARRSLLALVLHGVAVLLLALAFFRTHETIEGRIGLALAMAVEAAAFWAARARSIPVPGVEDPPNRAQGERRTTSAGPQFQAPQGYAVHAARVADGGSQPDVQGDAEASLAVPPDSGGTTAASTDAPLEPEPAPVTHMPATAEATPPVHPDQSGAASPDGLATTVSEASPATLNSEGGLQGRVDAREESRVPRRSFSTIVLFERPMNLTPTVFLASLRRAGQRDATMSHSSGPDLLAAVEAGTITLRLQSGPGRCAAPELDWAIDTSEEWSEARAVFEHHEAHAVLISEYDPDTPPDAVVRLHHRAHAALMEFASVAAVLWPAAERLDPPNALATMAIQASEAGRSLASTCTTIRRFELDGENAGLVLIDSLGLSAFGLPDVQVIASHPPAEETSTIARQAVERLFAARGEVEPIELLIDEPDAWRVMRVQSAFAPDREVVQISRRTARPNDP